LRIAGGADAEPVMQPQEWVHIGEAAQLMGESQANLRRRAPRMGAMAQMMTPVGGGKRCWHIHRSAHPALVRARRADLPSDAPTAESLALAELRDAPKEKQDDARNRAQLLIAFRRWRVRPDTHITRDYPTVAEAMAKAAGLDRPVSLRQVYVWDREAPASEHFNGVAAALLDRRRGPCETTGVSAEAWALFEQFFLDRKQWSLAKCHRHVKLLAEKKGWAWPGARHVARIAAERITPAQRDYHRLGIDQWSKSHAAPFEQDPDAFAAGECWEADHSNLDFVVRIFSGGKWIAARPWLTAWFDRRTRCLTGWRVSMEHNAASIRLALLHALRINRFSVPRFAWLDNGKDFASATMIGATKAERRRMTREEIEADRAHQRGLLAQLNIEAHFAVPYNHNGKARIERFFGTVHTDFDREWESWCGSKPGQVDRDHHRAVVEDVMALPTLEDAAAKFDAWARGYNLRSEHAIEDLRDQETGELLSPLRFMEKYLPERRVAADDALEQLELPWSRPLKVTKRGVRLVVEGEAFTYGECEPELEALVGTERRVLVSYDPAAMNAVSVYDEAGRFLCRASMNQKHGGVGDEPLRQESLKAGRVRRRQQQARAAMRHDLGAMYMTDAEMAIAAQRADDLAKEEARIRRETGAAPAAPMRLVRTPVDGQAAKVRKAEQRRLAAGAEERIDEPVIDLATISLADYDDCDDAAVIDLSSDLDRDDETEDTSVLARLMP
jgi:hypothetical protein